MSRALAAIAAVSCMLAACNGQSGTAPFETWRAVHQPEMNAYAAFLRTHDVANVVPMHRLLRAGRRWKTCRASEFEVPPRNAWPSMPDTLRALRAMQSAAVIAKPTVTSAFRTPGFNRREGGSARSKHLTNNALDPDLGADADARLCAWWRKFGPEHRLGLGFYTPTRIHIDTSGFRTWGRDHTHRTSLCNTRG